MTSSAESPEWKPKAIVFDLLTGLINSWDLWDRSTPSSWADGRLWRQRYLEITFSAGTYVPYEDLVRMAAREVGLPGSTPEYLLEHWADLQPWPEAGDVLRELKAKGYKLGVVTNCSERLGNTAARTVSTDLFDAVVTAEESGFYKPTKQAYDAILEPLGVKVEDVLFVAGSAGDVEGATKAGLKVVWHNHVGLPRKGDAVPLREGQTLSDTLRDYL